MEAAKLAPSAGTAQSARYLDAGADQDSAATHLRRFHRADEVSAISIEGQFRSVRVRAFTPQTKPYDPFAEVVQRQTTHEATMTTGTLIGFFSPDYLRDIGVAGYHFHFLSEDLQFGGHVLAFETNNCELKISRAHAFELNVTPPAG